MSFAKLLFSIVLFLLLSLVLSGEAYALATSPTSRQGLNPSENMSTQPSPSKSLQGSWKLRLQQRQLVDDFNQKSLNEFRLSAEIIYSPLENLDFSFAPQLSYASGFTQTQEPNGQQGAQWTIREAAVNTRFSAGSFLSAGALDQSIEHGSLLMAEQAFPAIKLNLQTNPQDVLSGGISLETAIPTTSSLTTQTQEFEKVPAFYSASLKAIWQDLHSQAEIRLGVFQFQDLPRAVASRSTYLGNTTESSTGPGDAQLVYQYQGSFALGELKLPVLRSLRLIAAGEWIKNNQAPTELNQGLRGECGAEWKLNSRWQFIPTYEFFRIEPDATVSAYNAAGLNTNRVGYQTNLTLAYKQKIKVTVSSGERDVVFSSPYQEREKTWNLKVESFNVAI